MEERREGLRDALSRAAERLDAYTLELQRHGLDSCEREVRWLEELIAKTILPQTQLRRLIRPEEIADAICFLIANSAVSGELWADAGWHPSA